jgi:hypothetical protein
MVVRLDDRPDASRTLINPFGCPINQNASPPGPHCIGSVTIRAALAAMAASTALPSRFSTSTPIADATA